MDFSYQNYVKRYNYEPYCWPPDIGLAELHARCSQPGPINEKGVQCPCCSRWSKKKISKWWNRNISEDLKEHGTAIPGYFQLIKFYSAFIICVLIVNSLYPIYATFYTCENFDQEKNQCLQVGILYYLQFNEMIDLLNKNNKFNMAEILLILQTAVFYILLAGNYLSILYITFLNESARTEIKEIKSSQFSKCLVFNNVSEPIANNMATMFKDENEEPLKIVKTLQLHEIKKYYDCFNRRNAAYYHLQSMYVQAEEPYKFQKLNERLKELQAMTIQQKPKMTEFSGKVLVMFEAMETKYLVHSTYKISMIKKWYYGVRTLLKQFKIYEFDPSEIRICTVDVAGGSDIRWENLGESMGIKMAIRIKTLFLTLLFMALCYIILAYPLLFSLRAHIKAETNKFVKLNTFEKVLPGLISIFLVSISIYFRIYMERLAEQRNPKDELEKSRFVLLNTLTFHIIFYVLIPTFFFMYPNQLSQTVKLYVISEQARTFIVIQIIIILVDTPYRFWKNNKINCLSDQRFAFRHNQKMLHKAVESRDYPLEIRLQVMFRMWSFVLFYSFFIPYILFYIIIAFIIIFWVEKRNLYKHYTIRRKVSIQLESEVLIYFVNFFCIYLCFVYCFNVNNTIKIAVAVSITAIGLIGNVIYWVLLSKADLNNNEVVFEDSSSSDTRSLGLLKEEKVVRRAQKFSEMYHQFMQQITNDELDKEIEKYLQRYDQYRKKPKKNPASIEMSSISNSQCSNSDSN